MQTTEPYLPKQGVTIDDEATVVSPVYAVRFRAGRQAANPTPNSYSLHGKGSVQFRGDELLIDAQRHRLFRSGVPERQRIALADIVDAHRSGTSLRFDVHPATAPYGIWVSAWRTSAPAWPSSTRCPRATPRPTCANKSCAATSTTAWTHSAPARR